MSTRPISFYTEVTSCAVQHVGSLDAVASIVGVPVATVKDWFDGTRKPTDAEFLRLVDIIYFWDFLSAEDRAAVLRKAAMRS